MNIIVRRLAIQLVFAVIICGALFPAFPQKKTQSKPVTKPKTGESIDWLIDGRDIRQFDRLELSTGPGRLSKGKFMILYRFLWAHWSGHENAFARLSISTFDAGRDYYFFVEEIGTEWVISVTSKHHQAYRKEETEHYGPAYFVERVFSMGVSKPGAKQDTAADNDCDYSMRFLDNEHKPIGLEFMY
jgi:hypothetical protein